MGSLIQKFNVIFTDLIVCNKNFGIFIQNRDNSRLIKSSETSWSSAQSYKPQLLNCYIPTVPKYVPYYKGNA